jgi:hypothetical protein
MSFFNLFFMCHRETKDTYHAQKAYIVQPALKGTSIVSELVIVV